jgi:hypothetical protein
MNTTAKAEITELLDRYLHSLDERKLDEYWARGFFTEDVRAELPIGTVDGIGAMAASTRTGVLRFDRTQHIGLNYLIDPAVDGTPATVRWNQLNHHVYPGGGDMFVSGTRCEAEVVRTDTGWRIAHMTMHVVWTTGRPPRNTGVRS